jgi:hypothetical protein
MVRTGKIRAALCAAWLSATAVLVAAVVGCNDSPMRPLKATLSGHVLTAVDSVPVPGARIVLVDGTRYTVVVGPETTDASGAYTFSDLPDGRFYAFVFADTFITFDRSAVAVEIARGQNKRLDIRMIPLGVHFYGEGFTIAGTVRDSLTGAPIAGAYVSDFFSDLRHSYLGLSWQDEAITDSQGRFRLSNLLMFIDEQGDAYGLFPIAATKEGYAPYVSGAFALPSTPDSTVQVDIRLVRRTATSSLTGRVISNGAPVAGIRVALDLVPLGTQPAAKHDPRKTPMPDLTALTDALGHYRFEHVPPAEYFVEPAYLPDDGYVVVRSNDQIVSVGVSDTVSMPDLQVVPALEVLTPSPRSEIADQTPDFSWSSVPNADTYHLNYETAYLTGTVIETDTTSYRIPDSSPFPHGSHIRWHVWATRGDTLLAETEDIPTFTVR